MMKRALLILLLFLPVLVWAQTAKNVRTDTLTATYVAKVGGHHVQTRNDTVTWDFTRTQFNTEILAYVARADTGTWLPTWADINTMLYLVSGDSTILKNSILALVLKNADSTTLKNSLLSLVLKNADSVGMMKRIDTTWMLANVIRGSGTQYYLPIYSSAGVIGNSLLRQTSTGLMFLDSRRGLVINSGGNGSSVFSLLELSYRDTVFCDGTAQPGYGVYINPTFGTNFYKTVYGQWTRVRSSGNGTHYENSVGAYVYGADIQPGDLTDMDYGLVVGPVTAGTNGNVALETHDGRVNLGDSVFAAKKVYLNGSTTSHAIASGDSGVAYMTPLGVSSAYQPLDADLTDLADGTLTGSKVQAFGTSNAGVVGASGGGTANYLRADGTWAEPPGATSSQVWDSLEAGSVFNAENFGAVGNGSTNNDVAFAAWLAAAKAAKGIAYLPAGRYVYTTPINIDTTGMKLLGAGQSNTVLLFHGDGTQNAINVEMGDAELDYVEIAYFTLVCDSALSAIETRFLHKAQIHDVAITAESALNGANYFTNGILIKRGLVLDLYRLTISGRYASLDPLTQDETTGLYGIVLDTLDVVGGFTTTVRIRDCILSYIQTAGIHMRYGSESNIIEGCVIQGLSNDASWGTILDSTTSRNVLTGVYYEGNDNDILINGDHNSVFHGNALNITVNDGYHHAIEDLWTENLTIAAGADYTSLERIRYNSSWAGGVLTDGSSTTLYNIVGDASSASTTLGLRTMNVMPVATGARDLGSTVLEWDSLFVQDIAVSGTLKIGGVVPIMPADTVYLNALAAAALPKADSVTGYLTPSDAAVAYQPVDADLTTIAGLTATTGNMILSAGSAWTSANAATVKTALSLQNVTNESKATMFTNPTFTGTVTIPTPFTLGAVSVLPTGTELNFVDGVTSAIQTQLDAKLNNTAVGDSIQDHSIGVGTLSAGQTVRAGSADSIYSSASDTVGLATALAGKQTLDADLTTIAGLTATTGNMILSAGSAWTSANAATVKTALSLNNVTNESKATMFTSPAFTTGVTFPTAWTGTIRAASGVLSATASDTVGLAAALAAKMATSTILMQGGVGTDSVLINTSYRIPLGYSTGIVIDTIVYIGMAADARNVKFQLSFGTDYSAAGTLIDTTTVTSNTTVTKQAGANINQATVPAGNTVWLSFPTVTSAFKTVMAIILGHRQ